MKVTTWDSDSEFERDDDSTHMCFMIQGDDHLEVNSESNLDFDDLSMEEIVLYFEQFEEKYKLLKIKNKNLKREWFFIF